MHLKFISALMASLMLTNVTAFAEESGDTSTNLGQSDYLLFCAACHGRSGTGDGSFAPALRTLPADLTSLSSNNGGIFPYNEIVKIIDGRQMIASHGIREMPVWGWQFRQEATDNKVPLPAELEVRNRISNLVDYIASLQSN
jgi:mono/diheme cytochrome c family protein